MKPLKTKTFLLLLRCKLFVCLFSCAFFGFVFAERLPLQVYTSADGLATSIIHNIYRDSQGFLWFSGRGGLSRFDGYEFTSYRLEDQSSPLVHRFIESRDGKYYWIATDAGLYRAPRDSIVNVQPTNEILQSGMRRMNAPSGFNFNESASGQGTLVNEDGSRSQFIFNVRRTPNGKVNGQATL